MKPRIHATRADAVRDVNAVTAFLAKGHPLKGRNGAPSAIRLAGDSLGVDRATFRERIGEPDRPGSHLRKFGLAPDWAIPARRGELGTAPVLPGYVISSTTAQKDSDGNLEREWVTQSRAPSAERFEVPAGQRVKGISALVDGQGRELVKWIKTDEERITPADMVEAIRAAFEGFVPRAEIPSAPADCADDLLTVYVVPDLHLGMLAHGPECGEDFDLRIAETMIRREVGRLMEMAPPSRHAVILFLGDFFHQNDHKNATPKSGHTLDVDGRWRKVYDIGARLAVGLARAVADRHECVEVAFLPGNHDEDAAVTLAVALDILFEGHERITVAPGKGIHWFRRFGRCLLGASHGHTMKPDRMAMMLATDRARDWGETDHRHFFFGHIHHETAKEVGPVRVESFSSPAAKDAYAAAGGYRSGRALNAVTFHAERGEVCRHRVNIQPARSAA